MVANSNLRKANKTPADEEEELGAGAIPGRSEIELLVRNSPMAADQCCGWVV